MEAAYRQTPPEEGYSKPPFYWFTGEIRSSFSRSFPSPSAKSHAFLAGRQGNGLDWGTFEKYEERR
jgi:hypothetical protein